jgi:H+/gluconate symporter-like permease
MLTIDVKTALISLLIIAVIVLVIFSIVAVYNLIKTLQQSQKVLSDFEVVAKVASERTAQLDKFIDAAQKKIKSGQNIFNSVPIIVAAVGQIAKVISQSQKKKD